MSAIDSRPQSVDLRCMSGDTLSFKMVLQQDYAGYSWAGQVRDVFDVDNSIDPPQAEFTFGTMIDNQDGTWSMGVTLTSEATEYLGTLPSATTGVTALASSKAATLQSYKGYWDIQISDSSVPPDVHTLVRGLIYIDADVTRL